MRRTTLLLAALGACAALIAGCGTNFDAENPNGSSPGSGGSEGLVAEQDVARVLGAIRTINALCEGSKPSEQQLESATNTLIDVYKLGPKHILKYGSEPQPEAESMQTAIVTQAQRLRQCGDPQYAERITKVAGTQTTAVQP